jgi:hypothetical protein
MLLVSHVFEFNTNEGIFWCVMCVRCRGERVARRRRGFSLTCIYLSEVLCLRASRG